jgi:NADH-quinone oxidoreductase subunit E
MSENLDLSKVEEVLQNHGKDEASLIPVLQQVQEKFGYLPEEALVMVGRGLNVPLSRIYGVVTFYAQFYLSQRGKHTVRVCRGTACHVRGGKQVLNAVQLFLGVGENETTPDANFTFETVACLGACALSPVLLVDKTYFGKLTAGKVEKILKQYT